MPDVVPNELNYEGTLVFSTTANQTVSSIVRLDFPLIVDAGDRKVVNIITDVLYDFPPNHYEITDLNDNSLEANERIWAFGLYKAEPTESQIYDVTPGAAGNSQLTMGNVAVYDHNVFAEAVTAVTASNAHVGFYGNNEVRKSMMFMGVGTVVPQSFIWLGVFKHRFRTTTWTTTDQRFGVRIKYVQTTIPLAEWVGLYFSGQQLA